MSDQRSEVKAARIGVIGVVIGATLALVAAGGAAALTGHFTAQGIRDEITAATSEAKMAYTRGVGTDVTSKYLAVLLDAEDLHAQAESLLQGGTIPKKTKEQLIEEIGANTLKMKAAKGPVDLVATPELRDIADLSMNLYGRVGGDLTAMLRGDSSQRPSDIKGWLKCETEAGRFRFTETAQNFLGLDKPLPEFNNFCYFDWDPAVKRHPKDQSAWELQKAG